MSDGIDLTPIVKGHFVSGDGILIDIGETIIKLYRKRGAAEMELVATVTRPQKYSVRLDGFGRAALDDFSDWPTQWAEDADLFTGEFEIQVYPKGGDE